MLLKSSASSCLSFLSLSMKSEFWAPLWSQAESVIHAGDFLSFRNLKTLSWFIPFHFLSSLSTVDVLHFRLIAIRFPLSKYPSLIFSLSLFQLSKGTWILMRDKACVQCKESNLFSFSLAILTHYLLLFKSTQRDYDRIFNRCCPRHDALQCLAVWKESRNGCSCYSIF